MNRKYRKTVIAGNWKMNMLASEIKPFMEQLKENLPKTRACDVVLCTPAPLLPAMIKAGKDCKVAAGGQDVSKYEKGAYTGEVSAAQLADIGAKRADICSLGTGNGHGDKRQGDLIDRNFQNLDLSRFSLYGFSFSCQIAELFSIHFQCGVHRRNLHIVTKKA